MANSIALAVLMLVLSATARAETLQAYDVPAGELTLRFWAYPDCFDCEHDPSMDFVAWLEIRHGEDVLLLTRFEAYAGTVSHAPYSVLPYGLDIDVTGDGNRDLVLSEYSGGAHCCISLVIFELTPDLKLLAKLKGYSSDVELKSLDADPSLEALFRDETFAYWPGSFGDSGTGPLVLDLREGKFVADTALMRHLPSPRVLSTALIEYSRYEPNKGQWKTWEPTPALWRPILELVYTGNGGLAHFLLDLAWPPGVQGKTAFEQSFCKRLSRSPYVEAVTEISGWCSPPPCEAWSRAYSVCAATCTPKQVFHDARPRGWCAVH